MNARGLQIVREIPSGPAFVVRRTRFVRPGTPYVVAVCVDREVADLCASGEAEILTRAQMAADGALATALEAWDRGDDALHHREEAAYERAVRGRAGRGIPWHPSRVWPPRR